MSLAIWSFAFTFDALAPSSVMRSFWGTVAAAGWCFFPVFILLLVLAITEVKQYNKELELLIFFPGMISFIIAVILNLDLLPVSDVFYNTYYVVNDLYNIIYIIISLYLLIKWGKSSTCSVHMRQANIIVFSGIVSFLLYFISEIVLVRLGINNVSNITHLYCIIMISGIYYSTVKYNFLLVSNTLINNELFDGIMDLTFLVDLRGKIIRANTQVYNVLEYSIEDLVNTEIKEIIQDEEFLRATKNIETISETLKLYSNNITTRAGKILPFNITISPLRDSGNQLILGHIVIAQDIRALNQLKNEIIKNEMTSEKLKLSEELFRTVTVTIPFSILFTKRRDNTIFYVNENAINLFKVDYETFIGYKAEDLYENPSDRIEIINKFLNQGSLREREIKFKKSNGEIFIGTITMVPAYYNGEEVILSCIADITEQKILYRNIAKSEEMMRKLLDSIPDLVLVSDTEGNINFTSKSIHSILGYNTVKDNVPDNVLKLIVDEQVENALFNMKRIMQEEIGPVEYRYKKKDGTLIDMDVNSTVLTDETKVPFGLVFVARDITERKKAEDILTKSKEEIEKINKKLISSYKLLKEKSVHDGLTGLYNHQYIIELLEVEIKKVNKTRDDLCLMMLDIDQFKNVNDTYGHQAGDMVLNKVATIITESIRETDYAGRYGGEEFMVILPSLNIKKAILVAERIRLKIQNYTYSIEGLKVTISIGLTSFGKEDAISFISTVDKLLYLAKENGRNRLEINTNIET
jgi:diguanylate cyclase (GGDEF)-like protein/PAS domain S-box-containing protein